MGDLVYRTPSYGWTGHERVMSTILTSAFNDKIRYSHDFQWDQRNVFPFSLFSDYKVANNVFSSAPLRRDTPGLLWGLPRHS